MSYKEQELGLMARLMPEKARAKLLAAHKQCNGNTEQTSKMLGISRRTILRYIKEFGVRVEIEAMREEYRLEKIAEKEKVRKAAEKAAKLAERAAAKAKKTVKK